MSTSDSGRGVSTQGQQTGFGWPQAPVGQPWLGNTTDRPPWEQAAGSGDPESTERIPPVPNVYQEAPPTPAPPAQPTAPTTELISHTPEGDGPLRRTVDALLDIVTRNREREPEEILARLRAPIAPCHRIAVTAVRGGAGKTAVSALLGSVFAERRSDPVLALDAAEAAGSLGWRLTTAPDQRIPTMNDLAPALRAASGQGLSALGQILPRTADGLWVLAGGSAGQPHLARDLAHALSRLFAVMVFDCGTGMTTPATTSVLTDAHAVVVVVPATPDGVRTTLNALHRAPADSLGRVVIALNRGAQNGDALDLSAAESEFARRRIPVEVVPHDRHLAGGTPVDPGKIAQPTRRAACRLAAQVLDRAQQL